jgi:hypothetical protein
MDYFLERDIQRKTWISKERTIELCRKQQPGRAMTMKCISFIISICSRYLQTIFEMPNIGFVVVVYRYL